MTSSGPRSTHAGLVRSMWLRRAGRITAVAIGATAVVALIAGIDLPHAIATNPFVGLALIAVIAMAVMSILALTQRWEHRWLLFGTFALVTLTGYALGRVDHVIIGSAAALESLLAVTALGCAVIAWPSRQL